MTRDEAKQLLPIIEAYANGEEVQYKDLNDDWYTRDDLRFAGNPNRYRIKPKPHVIYVNMYAGVDCFAHTTREEAEFNISGGGVTKKFIEVMDDK